MKLDIPNRILNFSKKEDQDVIKAGVELYKHYLHMQNSTKFSRFSESAEGKSYDEKNSIFNALFKKQSVLNAYLPESALLNDKHIFKNVNVQIASFALLSDILDVIIPQTINNSFNSLVKMDMVGVKGMIKYQVPNRNLFKVNKIARGGRTTEPQRLYNGDAHLIPEPRMITVDEDFETILTGDMDWGLAITKIALSFESAITTEIYSTIHATYDTLTANWKEAGYSQTAFTKLVARVKAFNRAPVVVMGSQTALSSVLPQNDYLKFALSEEYNKFGYIANFMGATLMEIPQTITPNTEDFAIADDTLYFFSMGADKLVRMAMEDTGMVFENVDKAANADSSYSYSIRKSWAMQLITSAKHGIMKVS